MGGKRQTAGQGQGDKRPVLSLPLYSRTELLKNLSIQKGHPSPYKVILVKLGGEGIFYLMVS